MGPDRRAGADLVRSEQKDLKFLEKSERELQRALKKKADATYPPSLPHLLDPSIPLSLPKRYTVATSSDGTKLAAAAASASGLGGGLYLSSNSGGSWSLAPGVPSGNVNMQAAAISSSNGSVIAGAVNGGNIWISTDSGASFAEQTSAPTATNWKSVVVSSGAPQRITAAVQNGKIWVSSDYGATFTST